MPGINLTLGDITQARVDAIVNAANKEMLGGGGVDGAIHRAAGPDLLAACKEVPATGGIRCPAGQARITRAGKLQARYVIHTVGPMYDIDPKPEQLLASAYHNTLQLALDHHCQSLAVPAISCGVYGYPAREAAQIALGISAGKKYRDLDIKFYLFSQIMFEVWQEVLQDT